MNSVPSIRKFSFQQGFSCLSGYWKKMMGVFHRKVKNSFGFGLVSIVWVQCWGKLGPGGCHLIGKICMENTGTFVLLLNYFPKPVTMASKCIKRQPLPPPPLTFPDPPCPLSPRYSTCSLGKATWVSSSGSLLEIQNPEPVPDLLDPNLNGYQMLGHSCPQESSRANPLQGLALILGVPMISASFL